MKRFLFLCSFAALLFACKSNPTTEQDSDDFAKTGNPAIDALTEQIKAEPDKDTLWALRGTLFYRDSLYEQSIRDYKKAIELDSAKMDYYHRLADAYLDFNQSKEAVITLETAIKREPTRLPTLLKLSEFQYLVKQYVQSQTTCNTILTVSPGNPEAYFMLGRNYKEVSDTVKAIEAFQKAIDLDADHYDSYIQLGLLYDYQRDPKAVAYLNNALRIDSLSTEANYALAMHYQNSPKPDFTKARTIYKKIMEYDPQYPEAYFNTAILYLEEKNDAEADKYLERCTKVEPTYAKAYHFRGVIAEKAGKKEEAIAYYQEASNLDPDWEEPKKGLERVK